MGGGPRSPLFPHLCNLNNAQRKTGITSPFALLASIAWYTCVFSLRNLGAPIPFHPLRNIVMIIPFLLLKKIITNLIFVLSSLSGQGWAALASIAFDIAPHLIVFPDKEFCEI